MIVNTNVGSLNAQRSLAASGAELKTAMERLSSGKKINSAADDAAGFAIAERMTAQIRGLNMATKNANDGLSMLAVIENATNDVTDMLQRMRELAVQAVNDTNSLEDRTFLQKEVSGLIEEIDRVAAQTQYNNQLVLNGSFQNKSIQVGTEAGQMISFSVQNVSASSIGIQYSKVGEISHLVHYPNTNQTYLESDGALTNFGEISAGDYVVFGDSNSVQYQVLNVPNIWGSNPGGANIDIGHNPDIPNIAVGDEIFKVGQDSIATISLETDASKALQIISTAIEEVAANRASYGALQNRLEYTVSNLMNVAEFTTAARSRIEDADFAAESARLAKAQVLQQTGTAMLAQANSSSQLVLSLIR